MKPPEKLEDVRQEVNFDDDHLECSYQLELCESGRGDSDQICSICIFLDYC
jgi:hypothetical protein